MDFIKLREVLGPLVINIAESSTHKLLPSECEKLGLPPPIAQSEGVTKKTRILESFKSLPDEKLPDMAQRYLDHYLLLADAHTRNKIQDLLWADRYAPQILKRYRHELARELDIEDLYSKLDQFDNLLKRLWVLNDPNCILHNLDHPLYAEIEKHVYQNNDWSTEQLFEKLGVFDTSDQRFALFLEGLASSDVRPNRDEQFHFVGIVNKSLHLCGAELRETGQEGGYPVFRLVACHAAAIGRPKNIIFASPEKPDIRFKDAVSNDIEIVANADRVLIYDRSIGDDGLRWRDLQNWWSEKQNISKEEEAKKTLYKRLQNSLPPNSPPQKLLFDSFHEGFGKMIPNLPALLPEVWLHWDPKTKEVRGRDALPRFRMDFLLLLPGGIRVVLEVDGKHHYSDDKGKADCTKYAEMVAADRELKLAGYHVFRFGAVELDGEKGKEIVKKFFDSLFKYFYVPTLPD